MYRAALAAKKENGRKAKCKKEGRILGGASDRTNTPLRTLQHTVGTIHIPHGYDCHYYCGGDDLDDVQILFIMKYSNMPLYYQICRNIQF